MLKHKYSSSLAIARTTRYGRSLTDESIHHYLSALGTPRALTVWLLYQSGEHDQLTQLEIDPSHYCDRYKFRDDYAATLFLSKAEFLKTSFNKKEQALLKFHRYEFSCGETNRRLKNLGGDPNFHGPHVWLLNAAIRKISSVLGTFDPERFVDECGWGPGVTTRKTGSHVSAVNKFHDERGITRDLLPLAEVWLPSAYPLWWEHLTAYNGPMRCLSVEDGNKVITVPKNSKSDRVIAVEPGLNLWFQKGVGSLIRRRLKRVDIDLNDQTRNQLLCRYGSKTRTLSTVDFSSASDSISLETVRLLLSEAPVWLQVMELLRCRSGSLEGSPIFWEKFSSMGNGFTFELESLIFYAAGYAVCEYLGLDSSAESLSVYGDDVVIPTTAFDLFSSFCGFLGFTVNASKSFSSGVFRESCGSHFFDGLDVKPIFLKRRISDVQAIYQLANRLRSYSHRRNFGYGCDFRFRGAWSYLLNRVPKPLRFRNSMGSGDGAFWSNFDEASPSLARYGTEGFLAPMLVHRSIVGSSDSPAVELARLWYPSDQEHRNTYDLRGRTKLTIKRVLIPEWYNLGPWV